jgi:hypothetical protein
MAALAIRNPSRRIAALGWVAAAVCGLGLSGCHTPGGPGYSANQFTYVSTEWQPYTISVIDTTTGETVWTVDVPVGRQLFMQFRRGSGPNFYRPDMMSWEIELAGRLIGTPNNQIPVPGPNTRRVDVELRPVPERPPTPPPPPLNAQRTTGVDDR